MTNPTVSKQRLSLDQRCSNTPVIIAEIEMVVFAYDPAIPSLSLNGISKVSIFC